MAEAARIAIAMQRRGRVEQFELPLAELRIGSASHCDVRLGPDEAAPEQLAIAPRGQGLWLRQLADEPRARLNGAPLREALVETRARLEIGAVVLTLELLAARNTGNKSRSALQKARKLALFAALPAAAYFAFAEPAADSALARSVTPPPLFPAHASEGCRQRERDAARAYAEERLAAADGKRERSPFAIVDGVRAVPMYEAAAACFRAGGEPERAREAAEAARRLGQQLEDALHGHHVRLEWFLSRGRYPAAAREVLALRELLAGRDDAYAQWLSAVARELQRLVATPKEGG